MFLVFFCFFNTHPRIVRFNVVELLVGLGHDEHCALERQSDFNGRIMDAIAGDEHQHVLGFRQSALVQQSVSDLRTS